MKGHAYKKFKHFGIVTDLPPEEVPAQNWTGGENVQFQDTATRRVGGYEAFAGTPSIAPLFSLNVIEDAVSYWVYCGVSAVWVTDGANHWNITPPGLAYAAEAGDWTGCILNGIPAFTNGHDAPFYWGLDPGVPCATLPGWPSGTSCKTIRAFKYHLIALNINDSTGHYPDALWWSEGAEPGALPQEWTPTPENDAGDMVLADTPGSIVDGLAMRDAFVVYKDFSTYSITYVAGQYVYTQRKNFLTSGLQSSNCVVEINGNHWVFTGTDVVRHDGQSFESVIQYKTKRALVDSIDPSKINQCCVVSRMAQNQVWICIPEQDQDFLSKAYIINTDTLEVGIRTLPLVAHVARGVVQSAGASVSWDSDSNSWESDPTFWNQQTYSAQDDSLLMADFDSTRLWSVDTADTNDGTPVRAFVERLSLAMDESDMISRRLLTRVIPRVEGNLGDTILIRVGSQSFFDQPISWQAPQAFVIGQTVAIPVQLEGRMLSIRFEAETIKAWKIHSYTLEFVGLGLY